MKELRPLGSEKLTGDEKLKRILEIANYGRAAKPSVNIDKPEYITESKIGGFYGIVKEKDGFYVKKGLTESTLEYIGGMFMKNKNKFSSYSEAFKRLEYIKGQEVLQEGTKYILKQTKTPDAPATPAAPPMEAAAPEPSMSEVPPMDSASPEGGMPPVGNEPDPSAEGEPSAEGGEENLRSSYMGNIQKFAGKLGQELRDQKDRLESDDIKYVLNMVISAVDLDQLDDDDFEEIADKFDPEKRHNSGGDGEMPPVGDEEFDDDNTPDEPVQEMYEENDSIHDEFNEEEDIDEIMASLDEFIKTPVGGEEESIFSKYSDLDGNDEEIDEYFYSGEDDDHDEVKHDMNSIKNYMDSMDQNTGVDWEEKLRGQAQRLNKVEKPQIDIDEISRAINNALSKYR